MKQLAKLNGASSNKSVSSPSSVLLSPTGNGTVSSYEQQNNIDNNTDNEEDDDDDATVHSVISATAAQSSPYWQSSQGRTVMKTLPPSAPPLDFRRLNWGASNNQLCTDMNEHHSSNNIMEDKITTTHLSEAAVSEVTGQQQHQLAVGSALQAARRNKQ